MDLKLVADLSKTERRFEAAGKLACYFGCSYFIAFIPDPEIGVLLPAPGFPQTMPRGEVWNDFLHKALTEGSYSANLPFPDAESMLYASGFAGPQGSVMVLLGGRCPEQEEVSPLLDIFPLLEQLFSREQAFRTAEVRVEMADKSAAKAEKLAQTIDQMRLKLKELLVKQKKDKDDIENLMQKKDEFMNVASHELKTPITSMKAYLQILHRKLALINDEVIKDLFDRANGQVDKITVLIEELLDVTKIQAGKMEYNFSDLDISALIEEVVLHLQMTVQSHQIHIGNNPSVMVRGDRHRLEQVINNLLSNSIKYSPNASQVIVYTAFADEEIKVVVKDFGVGVPMDQQELIFDRFFRVSDTAYHFSGLGLGLYISAEIIKRHHGQIGVLNPGIGSEFYFTLPLNPTPVPQS